MFWSLNFFQQNLLIFGINFSTKIGIERYKSAEVVKAKLQAETQPELFPPEDVAEQLIAARAILSQYRGLWQVEDTFRVSKHDLKIRPIYHWTPRRIEAHIAIAFMSLLSGFR